MDYPDFQDLVAAQGPLAGRRLGVPIARRRSADLLTPVSAYLALREPGGFAFLLESGERLPRTQPVPDTMRASGGGERLGRYSFLGKRPVRIVESRDGRTWVRRGGDLSLGDGAPPTPEDGSVFDVMARLLDEVEEVPVPGLPRFTGGAVGFLGYDAVRQLERLPHPPPNDLGTPDTLWAFYDTVAAFDHVTRRLVLIATAFVDETTDLRAAFDDATDRLDILEAELSAGRIELPDPIALRDRDPKSNVTREQFEAAVERAKEHIGEGDVFQVVLSQRFVMPFAGDAFNLYRALRQVNPSPYLFFLDFDVFQLAGSSPEVLVRVERSDDGTRRAEAPPLAGARPRGDGAAETAAREADLASSVTGEVDEAQRSFDVVTGCFPAGTVSGAPKVRAMELIDELEPVRRGPYAGAVGYADFSGNVDTCITIRTMLVHGRTAYVQAGVGVAADSDPGREYEETRTKARALLDAMRVAADGLL